MGHITNNITLFTILIGIVTISSLILIPSNVYAAAGATLSSIDDKLDIIQGKVQELLDGNESFYSVSSNNLPMDSGAIGIFADCSDTFFTQPGNDCVFSVDSIRYTQDQFISKSVTTGPKGSTTEVRSVPGKVLGVCIDFVDFGANKVSNCSPSLIETGEIGSSVGLGFGPELGGTVGNSVDLSFGIGPDFSWGTAMPVREPVQIPLPDQFNVGDKKIGGNILTDSQLGGILATKFVIIKHQDFIGDVQITGVKGAKINLVLARHTASGTSCTSGGSTVSCSAYPEFNTAMNAVGGIAGLNNIDYQQENPFGVTNVAQNNAGPLGNVRNVGLTNEIPSIGINNLLDGHHDDIQALTTLRNDQVADLISLDDIDMLLEKMEVKGLDQEIERVMLTEINKLPALFEKFGLLIAGAVDINGIIMDIKDTVDEVEQTVTDVENEVNGITMTIETEVNKIIMEIEDFFNPP